MHAVLSERVIINEGCEDEMECFGYRKNRWKTIIYYVSVFLSGGLLLFVFHWKPTWAVKIVDTKCRLTEAEVVLLKDSYKRWHKARVEIDQHSSASEVTRGKKNNNLSQNKNSHNLRFFKFQKIKYLWSSEDRNFHKLQGLDVNTPCEDFIHYHGLSKREQEKRHHLYGSNEIEIKLRPIYVLFVQEALNPFYIFQLYSVCLWVFGYAYYYFSFAIILMSVISISITVYQTRKHSITLRNMVASGGKVSILRGKVTQEISEVDLVPGDVIVIPEEGCRIPCDSVLVSGGCIVNESMLTGESVPVTKTALATKSNKSRNHLDKESSTDIYNPDYHKRHTLFCGTEVIQTRKNNAKRVTAVVVRTGFYTTKGSLIRAILFPKPMDFRLYRDAIHFICFLAGIATIGFIYTITIKVIKKATVHDIVIKALDIFTIAVPPALPAALTIGMVYAQRRLTKLGIFCISPQRINVSGSLDVVCFDKTGTLTDDHLELLGVAHLKAKSFLLVENTLELPRGPILHAMATCHSLSLIDGELKGDPLDLKMFEFTNWYLDEPDEDEETGFEEFVPTIVRSNPGITQSNLSQNNDQDLEIGIIRQFTFSSLEKRMSVIAQTKQSKHLDIYIKGAPETVVSLCCNDTVPEDFQEVLEEYTEKGLRVLALAWRPLDPEVTWQNARTMERHEVEKEANFLGLLIMQNKLKPETSPVIKQLKDAKVRTVMVTGDNILTAIYVGRQCGMIGSDDTVVKIEANPPSGESKALLEFKTMKKTKPPIVYEEIFEEENVGYRNKDENAELQERVVLDIEENLTSTYHFALDGKSFGVVMEYFPDLIDKMVVRGTIFARMSPDQKAQLVEALQKLGYCVGMTGDGSNDCGALKMAHVGVSLSEAEASVASPFTSKTPNIECIPILIREGRAALVTSFGIFKYMFLYSMIQFTSVLILNTESSFPGDVQFMYWDIAITTSVAILAGRNKAYPKIVSERPHSRLMEPQMLVALIFQMIIQIVFQVSALLILKAQSWFTPVVPVPGSFNILCFENTVVFYISSFQYIIVAFLFSRGPPFRKPLYTNVLFTIALILLTSLTVLLVLYPVSPLDSFVQLTKFPEYTFRLVILAIALANLMLSFLVETYIGNSVYFRKLINCEKCRKKGSRSAKYVLVEQNLCTDHQWPPIEMPNQKSQV